MSSSSSSSSSTAAHTSATDLTGLDWPRLLRHDETMALFSRTFFPRRDLECQRFLSALLTGRCLVFHAHHHAVQTLWLEALRACRVNMLPPSAASPSQTTVHGAFSVYYTLMVADPETRFSAAGMCHYPSILAVKALCHLFMNGPNEQNTALLSSLFEIPRALLQAVLRSESSELVAHIRNRWLCAQCYEKALLDSTDLLFSADALLLDLLFQDDFLLATNSPNARLNKGECRTLLHIQSDIEARRQLFAHYRRRADAARTPYALGGGRDQEPLFVPHSLNDIPADEVTAYIARDWQEQLRRRAERTVSQRELTSDAYVLCAYVLFIVEAMRFHATLDSRLEWRRTSSSLLTSSSSTTATAAAATPLPPSRLSVAELLTLFPVCMAVVRGENTDYANDVLDKCEQAAPGVCDQLIQNVADTVREFMLNPHTASRSSIAAPHSLYPPAPALVLMLNIRTCVEPLLQRFDELRRVLHTALMISAAPSGSLTTPGSAVLKPAATTVAAGTASSGTVASALSVSVHERRQRAHFHRVDHTTLDALLFDVLLERTIDVATFNSLADWMHNVKASASSVGVDVNDHVTLRRYAHELNSQYTVVCFFDVNHHRNNNTTNVNQSSTTTHRSSADYFALTGTLDFLARRYPELQLCEPRMRHVGYTTTLGPFLVVHKDILWMLRHAMLNSVLTGDKRSYTKNTPVYPLLISTYLARNTSTSDELLALIEKHDHRAMFLPRDVSDSSPRAPLTDDPNVFALRCMIDTLGEWLDVPATTLDNGSSWRYGVPTSQSQHFGAFRFLHRLVDQLQFGHDEAVRRVTGQSAPAGTDDEYFLDTDAGALNAVRSFLQLRLPHTISYDTFCSLCERFPLSALETRVLPHHVVELTQLLHALKPLAEQARIAWKSERDRDGVGSYNFCNAVLSETHALYRTAKFTTDEPSRVNSKRPRSATSTSAPKKVSRSATASRTASTFERHAGSSSCRVPILCTPAVIAALPTHHSLVRLIDEHERITHANMLFYSASLSDSLELATSYTLLCDMQATGPAIDPTQLFSKPRYAGTQHETMQNFRFVRSHYERNIFKPRGHTKYGCGRAALAYSPLEPMDALKRFLMRLDLRHTCGGGAHATNVLSPLTTFSLGEALPPHQVQWRELDADAERPLSEVDIHTALPLHIETDPSSQRREIFYAENTFLTYTTVAYEECQTHIGTGVRAALELTTAMTNYCNMADYAARLRHAHYPQLGPMRPYEPGVWVARRFERARRLELKNAARQHARERAFARCSNDFASFQAALEYDDNNNNDASDGMQVDVRTVHVGGQ